MTKLYLILQFTILIFESTVCVRNLKRLRLVKENFNTVY